jgi:hypothetical protein
MTPFRTRVMPTLSRVLAAAAAVGLLVASPAPVRAWGMDVHRWLTRRAIDGLPIAVRPFFQARRDFISEHAADPDLWRAVGLRGDLGEEDPNHFLDLDGLDEPPPFTNVPRDLTAFIARYGTDRATKAGHLPWRVEEIYKRLVTAFQDIGKPTSPYAAGNAQYLVAVLSHYVEDAHVPFHATVNHDGQLTGQRGIHGRFESDLVLRNLSRLNLAPVTTHPIPNVRDFIFDTLVVSQSRVAAVLDADRRAAEAHPNYDDAYYAALLAGARPVLEQRLSEAATSVASVVMAAWEAAGRPKLPVDAVR